MTVKATRHYKIVRPGEIYPTAFNAGDTLPEWAAAQAIADGAAGACSVAEADGVDPAPATSDQRIVAVMLRGWEHEDAGKVHKYRKGVKVYGEVAAAAIAAGAAEETKLEPGAPETK
jgi:hypothetical protein